MLPCDSLDAKARSLLELPSPNHSLQTRQRPALKGVLPSHQNIHLVAKWLSTLEKKLEEHSKNSHPDFRVFISAEPAPSPEGHIIPQGILENSIKITSEPPTGMHANLHKALDNFTQVRPRVGGKRSARLQRPDSARWETSVQQGAGTELLGCGATGPLHS